LRLIKTINQFLGLLGECMGKKLTYDDVLSEAVYSVLETLRVKHEKAIIKELKTSNVLIMDTNQLGEMMHIITEDVGYREMVNKKFLELRAQYLAGGNYDPSSETIKEQPKVNNDASGDVNFGY
jgi:outer membrane protein assembly factor BamA